MRVNGYKCEICPEVVDVDFHRIRFPGGWFSLEYLAEENELEELHFCSIGCLSAWALKQMPVIEEVKEEKGLHYKLTVDRDVVAVEEYRRDL